MANDFLMKIYFFRFVTVLARDLREDFYPYFQSFLSALIHLLNTKDSDQLEWTLICLAHLFKTLKPFLKKDITVVFNSILPLLDDRNPEHVTNFAAECFSFVARDIKNKEKFLALILNGLKEQKNGVTGCGRLFVDIVRGVNGQFHSCAEDFVKLYFSGLTETNAYDQETLFEVMTAFINGLVQNIHPNNMKIYWDTCYNVLNSFNQNALENDVALRYLLTLIGQTLEHREGKYLADSSAFLKAIGNTLNVNQITEDCLLIVSQIVAAVLLSRNVTLTQLDASIVISRVIKLPFTKIFESFVWNTVNCAQFEMLILPEFLRYIDGKYYSESALELLAKIVLNKSPLCRDGTNLIEKKLYALRFKTDSAVKRIETAILNGSVEVTNELLLAAIVYPHINGKNPQQIARKIAELVNNNLKQLKPNDNQINNSSIEKNRKIIFILSILIETQIHLANKSQEKPLRPNAQQIIEHILSFCHRDDNKYIHALRLLDLIVTSEITQSTVPDFTLQLFAQIHEKLSNNLSSRFSDIRLITSHVFLQFSHKLKVGITHQGTSIYELFHEVESIIPSVQSYREQLLHLQKIEASPQLYETITKEYEPCKYDPLKYMLGYLYVNFSLLWKPLMELVQTHASELDLNEFWPIFESKINETTKLVRRSDNSGGNVNDVFGPDSIIQMEYSSAGESNERAADLINYRILLWRLIPTLGMTREIKNREIVTVFLDFINEEYRKSYDNDTFTWNIMKKRRYGAAMEIDDTDTDGIDGADDDAAVDENDDVDNDKNQEGELPKATQRTLITMLQVFVNQNNPKQLYREPELSTLYMQLLSHRNTAVQKAALDCIVAYKHKYLQPYKDHIYNLIDDGKFKEAITNFKIDKESNIVQEQHRSELLPIMMRVLFSKMQQRVGGQKHTNQLKKSLVMRFLGGCHEDEILIMLNMSFYMFEEKFSDNTVEMCHNIAADTDLSHILSPRKLQSSLDLIDVIQSEFSGLMSSKFHKYLLKTALAIGSIIHGVLSGPDNQSKISTKLYGLFKNLRSGCIQNLQRFFNHFHDYPWTNDEINAIFTIFVQPLIKKLPQDSLLGVTPLVKLLSIWGKTPRLFVLLTKNTFNGEDDTTPLKYLMDLLNEPKARPLVYITVMEIVQSLLTLNDEAEVEAIALDGCRIADEERVQMLTDPDSFNFGSKILLPYLPKILQKFQKNLKSRRGLTKRDLSVLSRATELITDAETCSTLLTLLLPILVRKSHSSAGEEVLLQMVNTVINLFNKIDQPELHIRNIAPMFEQISAVVPRKRLCDLLRIISGRAESDLTTMVDIIIELNAFDRRWVEQPDYERRLIAYKQISKLLAENQIDLNFGLLIIYHSFHFIRYDKDLALRDSASYHLKTLVPALIKKYQKENPHEVDYLIGTVILNMVRRTLRDRNDNVRYEGIQLLGEMARECPDAHPVLYDLHCLTSRDDREIDFFDNVTHLQSLRHGKALIRFGTVAKTLEKVPHPRTLTQFILPLASLYIANEKYASKHGLVTSAIEAIGSVCRLLPWYQYETILKYYLKSMRYNVQYQKQMVRIVMQILDAFHFDLSKANVTSQEIKTAVKSVAAAEHVESDVLQAESEVKDDSETAKKKFDGEEEEILIADDRNVDAEFDEALDNINQESVAEADADLEEQMPVKKTKICVFDKPTVLSHSVAKKLVHTIATGLIPTLNNSITALSTFESFHKLNKKKRRSEREEEEISRVPIALAVVKLLQKLPEGMLGEY